MSGNDRYSVMRRSISHVSQHAITTAAGIVVAKLSKNRVCLIICGPIDDGINATFYARPEGVSGTNQGWPLAQYDTTLADTFEHRPLVLNIWDHGDAVRLQWNVGTSGGSATITVIEVFDPEVKEAYP